MYEYEIEKIKGLVSREILEKLCECEAIIAGGAITSVFTGKEVNDVDVYFKSPQNLVKFLCLVYDGNWDMRVVFQTDKSITLRDSSNETTIQLITFDYYKDAEEIFKAFDFTINMGALELYNDFDCVMSEHLALHEEFMKHNSQRYLKVNPKTKYPMISALRVNKYLERGYSISKSQFLRLLLAINRLEINSWEEMLTQLGGLYGESVEDIFDTNKEFDLESAIEQLDYFRPKKTCPPCASDLTLQGVINAALKGHDYRKDLDGVWFAVNYNWTNPTEGGDGNTTTKSCDMVRGSALPHHLFSNPNFRVAIPTEEQINSAQPANYRSSGYKTFGPGVVLEGDWMSKEELIETYKIGATTNVEL